ncbi:MAG: Hsp70 family protein [Candidatus Methylacidiphilales bacterium]
MSDIIGIDLGTSNSAVGVVDSGLPVLIPDSDGRRLTPSLVFYPVDSSLPPLVGAKAREGAQTMRGTLLYSTKRLMGRRYAECSAWELGDLQYAVVSDSEGWAAIRLNDRLIKPEDVASLILAKLKQDAEVYLGREIQRAVISVPAYFNEAQREKTKLAATRAGLRVERMLSEPTAAALAYGTHQRRRQGHVAVYDLGGGTFDVSILHLNDGVFEVKATCGNTRLGGDDVDLAVVEAMEQEIIRRGGTVIERTEGWRRAAVLAKEMLSLSETTEIDLQELAGCGLGWRITREDLEAWADPVLEKTRVCCQRALQDAGLRMGDLDAVLLVGGQTRMPLVAHRVAEYLGKNPETPMDPEEAVARGAAIQAGILSGVLSDLVLLDVTPLSLGLETYGGLMNVLIPRNRTIPCKAGEVFTNAVDGQRSMQLTILQGERELAKDNWKLGEMALDFDPMPRGKARVGVQFEIDADGLLHVLARDLHSGKERKIQVLSAVQVDSQQVEKMVAESVDFAFEDIEARRVVEAQTKAQKLAASTRAALAALAGDCSAALEDEVRSALERLMQICENGSSREIKRAMEKLDQTTLPLADLLVDRAMAEATRRALSSSAQ